MWPFVIAGAAILLLSNERRERVFISYDHSEDVRMRNLLEAWSRNSQQKFQVERTSPLERINSDDPAVVKRALTPMLKRADCLLVIVGENTAKSPFVRWEIERAQETDVNLKMAAIKLKRGYALPEALKGGRCSWAVGFTEARGRREVGNRTPCRLVVAFSRGSSLDAPASESTMYHVRP